MVDETEKAPVTAPEGETKFSFEAQLDKLPPKVGEPVKKAYTKVYYEDWPTETDAYQIDDGRGGIGNQTQVRRTETVKRVRSMGESRALFHCVGVCGCGRMFVCMCVCVCVLFAHRSSGAQPALTIPRANSHRGAFKTDSPTTAPSLSPICAARRFTCLYASMIPSYDNPHPSPSPLLLFCECVFLPFSAGPHHRVRQGCERVVDADQDLRRRYGISSDQGVEAHVA